MDAMLSPDMHLVCLNLIEPYSYIEPFILSHSVLAPCTFLSLLLLSHAIDPVKALGMGLAYFSQAYLSGLVANSLLCQDISMHHILHFRVHLMSIWICKIKNKKRANRLVIIKVAWGSHMVSSVQITDSFASLKLPWNISLMNGNQNSMTEDPPVLQKLSFLMYEQLLTPLQKHRHNQHPLAGDNFVILFSVTMCPVSQNICCLTLTMTFY